MGCVLAVLNAPAIRAIDTRTSATDKADEVLALLGPVLAVLKRRYRA